jgi:V/A-type H+/Na+-transporting ATPase subunit E
MTPDDNLERLSKEIFAQAESETGQILTDAHTKADRISKQARQDAEAEKSRILDQAKREVERLSSQTIATTQLKARTLQLESREKLLREVFDSADKKLASVQQWSDYEAVVKKLILEAAQQLEAKSIKISADKVTQTHISDKMIKEIEKEFGGKITLAEPLTRGTGIIASTDDGHLTFDNTLETRLAHLESELRAPVYHVLMGESI